MKPKQPPLTSKEHKTLYTDVKVNSKPAASLNTPDKKIKHAGGLRRVHLG